MTITREIESFLATHQACGALTADATPPGPDGYLISIDRSYRMLRSRPDGDAIAMRGENDEWYIETSGDSATEPWSDFGIHDRS